eukprot:gb/GECG01000154.1/.p1 GENE.gb/GECG01000154.1/~~gb/GECG01000154.1/.p1  ORF type:complete len:104 (+),score=13.12 gb/GECG01000154.1/:1-312(+)
MSMAQKHVIYGLYYVIMQEDIALLGSGELDFGSNRRNCTVVLKGEKEVCNYYIELYREVYSLLEMDDSSAMDCIQSIYCGDEDIDKYMRNVLFPLLSDEHDMA